MNNTFDIGIVGLGIAGAFATLKISKEHKNMKIIGFDLGRPPAKRRQQTLGFLGCLPNSDGKIYLKDIEKVAELTGIRRVNSAHKYFNKVMSNVVDLKIVKDKSPNASMIKKINKIGYDVSLNDYIQLYPHDIHALSKHMVENFELTKNITFNFDSEVQKIYKQKNMFVIIAEGQEYKCKKLIIAVGRSGWRWARDLYNSFDIIDSNDIAKFGIRVEMSSAHMKDFNKSNCSLNKGNDIEIGPLSWFGTVIPEDHLDMAISAFRSNENRWKSDKVSFSLIGNRPFSNFGFEQTDRLGKLTFVLANDRIIKERVTSILNGKSKISIIPEYDWLKETINEIAVAIPEIVSKAYFHVPTITPMAPKINIGDNLESEIDGMYVAGESAGIHGILSAGCLGLIAADSACK